MTLALSGGFSFLFISLAKNSKVMDIFDTCTSKGADNADPLNPCPRLGKLGILTIRRMKTLQNI